MKKSIQWYKTQLRSVHCSTKGGWVRMANRYAIRSERPPVSTKHEARRLLAEAFGDPPPEYARKAPSTWSPAKVIKYVNPNSDSFLDSYEWRRVRMEALKLHGARCQCCGASPTDGVVMHVDHIKPRKNFPNLALDVNNLQVLCEVCNHGKGNWDSTDWRPAPVDDDYETWLRSIKDEELK